MRHRQVVLTQIAEGDLDAIADWLADHAALEVALRYVKLIRERVATLSYAAERGTLHTDAIEPTA